MGEVYKVQRKNATRGLHNDITRNKKHTISTNTSAGASSGVGAKTKTSTSKKSGGKTAASSKDRPATAPGTVNRPSNSKMTASNNNCINMSGNSKDDSNQTNSTKTKIVTPPKPILRSSSYGNFARDLLQAPQSAIYDHDDDDNHNHDDEGIVITASQFETNSTSRFMDAASVSSQGSSESHSFLQLFQRASSVDTTRLYSSSDIHATATTLTSTSTATSHAMDASESTLLASPNSTPVPNRRSLLNPLKKNCQTKQSNWCPISTSLCI